VSDVVLVPLERAARRSCGVVLRHGGFRVEVCASLDHAVHVTRKRPPAAVVVAVAAEESATAVATLRRGTDSPILVISSAARQADKVSALDAGADDYVTQPYGVDELLARVRALIRRRVVESDGAQVVVTPDFSVDLAARRLRRSDGTDVQLTAVEWRVLEVLLRQPGCIVTREEILDQVWGPKGGADVSQYLRVYVLRLRQKIEPDPRHPRYVMTSFGVGLYFSVDGTSGNRSADGAMMEA